MKDHGATMSTASSSSSSISTTTITPPPPLQRIIRQSKSGAVSVAVRRDQEQYDNLLDNDDNHPDGGQPFVPLSSNHHHNTTNTTRHPLCWSRWMVWKMDAQSSCSLHSFLACQSAALMSSASFLRLWMNSFNFWFETFPVVSLSISRSVPRCRPLAAASRRSSCVESLAWRRTGASTSLRCVSLILLDLLVFLPVARRF